MNLSNISQKYYLHSVIMAVGLLLFYMLGINTSFLYTSVLDYKNIHSDIFDGTVPPIEYVPNPLVLTYEQRKQPFSEIDSKYFIKTPVYTPNIFSQKLESFGVKDQVYKDIITQRAIYTVPYMGTYNFDFQEFSGSHPGVDIIAPEGTPVRNIANGVVVDIGNQSAGFGKYVLVKHNKVPLPSGEVGEIYSVYAHLSQTIASIGTKIKKGELIGYVGQTGTATTPHLHFQIDLVSASYNPYWPFTTADMKKAGVGFFEAVNIGLGKENAMIHTINPLKFVHQYESTTLYTTTEIQENITSPELTSSPEKQKENIPEIASKVEEEKQHEIPLNTEEIEKETPLVTQEKQLVLDNTIQVVKKEELVSKEVELLSSIQVNMILNPSSDLPLLALQNEELEKVFDKIDDTSDFISEENISIPTPSIDVEVENTIKNEDTEQNQNIFKDISPEYPWYTQVKYFKENNIVNGFSDQTFRPKNNITRIESLKVILLSAKISPLLYNKSQFSDIGTQTWENTYVNAAIEKGIVSLDNTKFYPQRNISRVEGLKLILNIFGVDFEEDYDIDTIEDIKKDDWYFKYVGYALKNNLFFEFDEIHFQPNQPLTREELIYMLYKIIQK